MEDGIVFCPSTLHIGLKYYYINNVFSINILFWVDLFDYKILYSLSKKPILQIQVHA